MKYDRSHWENVATLVNEGQSAEQIQNHYPMTTVATVKVWIRRCKTMGLVH